MVRPSKIEWAEENLTRLTRLMKYKLNYTEVPEETQPLEKLVASIWF